MTRRNDENNKSSKVTIKLLGWFKLSQVETLHCWNAYKCRGGAAIHAVQMFSAQTRTYCQFGQWAPGKNDSWASSAARKGVYMHPGSWWCMLLNLFFSNTGSLILRKKAPLQSCLHQSRQWRLTKHLTGKSLQEPVLVHIKTHKARALL